jgi:hypothetical protein
MWMWIIGIVWRGRNTSRVLYLENGLLRSARIPNRFLPGRAFPRGIARASRPATQRDLGHELVLVTLDRVIHSRTQHSRCRAVWGFGRGTALVVSANAIPGRVIEIERRNLR